MAELYRNMQKKREIILNDDSAYEDDEFFYEHISTKRSTKPNYPKILMEIQFSRKLRMDRTAGKFPRNNKGHSWKVQDCRS